MTDTLKTVIVAALNATDQFHYPCVQDDSFVADHHCCGCTTRIPLEPFATAIRDHFQNQRFEIFATVNQAVRGEITPERAADMIRLAYLTALIEGLAAGGSEG